MQWSSIYSHLSILGNRYRGMKWGKDRGREATIIDINIDHFFYFLFAHRFVRGIRMKNGRELFNKRKKSFASSFPGFFVSNKRTLIVATQNNRRWIDITQKPAERLWLWPDHSRSVTRIESEPKKKIHLVCLYLFDWNLTTNSLFFFYLCAPQVSKSFISHTNATWVSPWLILLFLLLFLPQSPNWKFKMTKDDLISLVSYRELLADWLTRKKIGSNVQKKKKKRTNEFKWEWSWWWWLVMVLDETFWTIKNPFKWSTDSKLQATKNTGRFLFSHSNLIPC